MDLGKEEIRRIEGSSNLGGMMGERGGILVEGEGKASSGERSTSPSCIEIYRSPWTPPDLSLSANDILQDDDV